MVSTISFSQLRFLLMKSKYEVFFSGSVAGRDVLIIDQQNVMEKSD